MKGYTVYAKNSGVEIRTTSKVSAEESATEIEGRIALRFFALETAKIENFHFHDLRHTFASYLRQKGVDLHSISKLLGHKDLRMTKRYAHLNVDSLRRAVSVLEKENELHGIRDFPAHGFRLTGMSGVQI